MDSSLSLRTIESLAFECTKHKKPVAVFTVKKCDECQSPSRDLRQVAYEEILSENNVRLLNFEGKPKKRSGLDDLSCCIMCKVYYPQEEMWLKNKAYCSQSCYAQYVGE